MNEDKRIEMMRTMKVSKAIMMMAAPAIIGFLVQAIYNFVDTIFVSWINPTATGATQVVFVLHSMVTAIGIMFGAGTANYVSRLLGKGDKDKASNAISAVSVIAGIVGVLVTIVSIAFLKPLLSLVGASDSLMGMSYDYGFYLSLSFGILVMNIYFNNVLRGEGSAKLSMISMAIGAVVNIILDPIFIFALGLGIKGAAIATSISQVCTFVILLYIYLHKKSVLRLSKKNMKQSKELWLEVLKIGVPVCLGQLLLGFSMSFLNNAANQYGGDNALAAVGMVMKILIIIIYSVVGFSMGFQPVAGYNYGAKNKERLQEAIRFSMVFTFLFCLVCFVVIQLFGSTILLVFKPSPEVLENAETFFKYYSYSIILMFATTTSGFFYQAIGKAPAALFISMARQGLFLIPSVLILPRFFGLEGVFLSQPVADLLLTLCVIPMLFLSYRKVKLGEI